MVLFLVAISAPLLHLALKPFAAVSHVKTAALNPYILISFLVLSNGVFLHSPPKQAKLALMIEFW
jgi:hypothetical protein